LLLLVQNIGLHLLLQIDEACFVLFVDCRLSLHQKRWWHQLLLIIHQLLIRFQVLESACLPQIFAAPLWRLILSNRLEGLAKL